jgi:hypothetical protein
MSDAVNIVRMNDDLYLMSKYARQYNLYDVDNQEHEQAADLPSVSHGLVFCDDRSDPQDSRRSRTALILDSVAEICLSEPKQVYAVGCVVPLERRPTSAIPNDKANKGLTLLVAENRGVTIETQRYLQSVIDGLQRISKLARPVLPAQYNPYSRSPSPPEDLSIQSK